MFQMTIRTTPSASEPMPSTNTPAMPKIVVADSPRVEVVGATHERAEQHDAAEQREEPLRNRSLALRPSSCRKNQTEAKPVIP